MAIGFAWYGIHLLSHYCVALGVPTLSPMCISCI